MTNPPPQPTEEASKEPPRPTSWSFWRLRLARLVLIGGLGLVLFQLLSPKLDSEQLLEIVAPEGSSIASVDIAFRPEDEDSFVGGAALTPLSPSRRLLHRMQIPKGRYVLEITAWLCPTDAEPPNEKAHQDAPCRPRTGSAQPISMERAVELDGQAAKIALEKP